MADNNSEIKNFKNIKKIGLGIVAFDATEHLVNIISEIRDLIDYVVVGVQKISYHGAPIAIDDYREIIRLKEEDKLVDDIYEVDLDINKKPREQETDKRNHLIDMCAQNGCSHCLIIDSDEFYPHPSFLKAIKEIDDNDYPVTYCQYINYWFDYQHYLVYPFEQGQYVPFVSRVGYHFSFDNSCFRYPSDPTRRYLLPVKEYKITVDKGKQFKEPVYALELNHIFPWETVKMHHLSWVRSNIRKKLNNWSSKKLFQNFEDLIDRSVERFENFSDDNIDIPAELLFNTPGHKVDIEKLPRQYIWPKYDIHTRLRKYYQQKKILILIMSCNDEFFINEEKVCRETYLKDIDHKNLDVVYYFYRGKEAGSQEAEDYIDEENRILHINSVGDGLEDTYEKTIAAFKLLEKAGVKYDYVVRTNTSTWINLDLLDLFLGELDNETINYAGNLISAWWSYYRFSMSGNSMIMPYRNVHSILLDEKRIFKDTKGNMDDCIISAVFNSRYIELGIDYTKYLKSVGIKHYSYLREEKEFSDEDFSRYMFFQMKPFLDEEGNSLEIKKDISIYDLRAKVEYVNMRNLDKAYNDFFNNIIKEYNVDGKNYLYDVMYQNVLKNIDKDYAVLKCSKQDYLTHSEDYIAWNVKDENKYTKEEAIEILRRINV